MNNRIFLSAVLALGISGLVGCSGDSTANNVVANRNTANGSATNLNVNSNTAVLVNNYVVNSNVANEVEGGSFNFMKASAEGGMIEVELGKLTASKAQSAEVKQFGQKMVTDHTKIGDDLKAVAAKKKATLPTEVNAKQKELMDKLSKLSGADFDKEYVKAMVDDHEEDVKEFQKQADSGNDPDVKAFAAKALPTLKAHLDMIKNIQSKIK